MSAATGHTVSLKVQCRTRAELCPIICYNLHASWAPIALHHPFTNLYILNETVQPFDTVHD